MVCVGLSLGGSSLSLLFPMITTRILCILRRIPLNGLQGEQSPQFHLLSMCLKCTGAAMLPNSRDSTHRRPGHGSGVLFLTRLGT